MSNAVAIDYDFLHKVRRVAADYLKRIHQNDREDYIQDVYINLWKLTVKNKENRSIPNSLIRAVARNVYFNYMQRLYRKRKLFEDKSFEEYVSDFEMEENDLVFFRIVAYNDYNFDLVELKLFINTGPFSNREKEIIQYIIEKGLGLTVAEIAKNLGVTKSRISNVYSKFIKKVRASCEQTQPSNRI